MLFRRHLRQVHGYLDILLEDLDSDVDAAIAVLLYPSRPAETIAAELEEMALSQGITVVYYAEMAWKAEQAR